MAFSDLTEQVLEACVETFGENVTYTPLAGSPVTVKAIFNARSVELEGGVPVMTYQPNLGVKVSDFAGVPAQGDTVTVRSVSYKVARVDEDGEGGALLFLREA